MLRYASVPHSLLLTSCFLIGLSSSSSLTQTAPAPVSPQVGATAQPTSAGHTPADLSKDPRLDRRLTLHEVGTPFSVLLQKVGAPGLTLTIETDSAEQKVHIKINQRSVRQLMQSLADVFAGAWYTRQDGSGYRFEMNYQTVRRRRRWWELFLQEREKAVDSMRAAALHTMRTPPQPPAHFVRDHSVEDGIDEETWRKTVSEKTFFGTLPPTLQEQVAGQIDEVPWYNMRGLITSGIMDEAAFMVPVSAFPDEMQSKLNASLLQSPQNGALANQQAYVKFINFGGSITAMLVGTDGRTYLRMLGSINVPFGADIIPLKLNQEGLPEEVKKRGKAAPPAWKELAAYQQSRVWPDDPPKQYPQRDLPNRIDVQEWLAETQGVEFVSDYYTAFRGVTNSKPPKLAMPLKEELDWQAQAQDISWKQGGGSGLYLFRNNRWYRDDLLEIPTRVLQRLIAYKRRQIEQEWQWQKQGNVQTPAMYITAFYAELDGIADAVYTLTPWQLFNGLANVVVPAEQVALSPIEQMGAQQNAAKNHDPYPRRAFEMDIIGIMAQYRTLRLYGSFSKEERAALLAGHLDVNLLSPAQQQQARLLLPQLQNAGMFHFGEPLLIGIRPAAGGGFIGMPYMRLFLSPPAAGALH